MAGMVPIPPKSFGGRKQWTLHDGPRGSLRRLRNQLAEDGCPESQVVLAKQLLDEKCEMEIDKLENEKNAIYWLVKASEQCNDEATNLLKKCFRTGRGINEHNYLDVKSCINMNQHEKLARKAAREVFVSLSNGEDFITSEQLEKRMMEIYNDEDNSSEDDTNAANVPAYLNGGAHHSNHLHDFDNVTSNDNAAEIDWSTRLEIKSEKLTEDNVVAAAVNYAHGELPHVNRILCLTKPRPNSLDHIPYIYRFVFHPLKTFRIFYYRLVHFLSFLPKLIFSSVFVSNFSVLCLTLIYIFINTENKLSFLSLSIYYLSLIIMIIFTFRMLQHKHDYVDFRVWSGLFLQYSGGSLNAEEAEFQFIRNNLRPYAHFFVALLINLMIYPVVQTEWIPESELTIIALSLMFMTLLTFVNNTKMNNKKFPDYLPLFSFAINVLAKYPYESDAVVTKGWRFLDLKIPSFTSYVIGNGVEFCLNFRMLFLFLIPICFGKLAMRDNWRGIYKFLIPHCVTLSWLQIAINCSKGATMYGMLRGTLAIVGSVFFLPLTALTVIHLPIVIVVNYIYESDYLITFMAVAVFALIVFCGSHILNNTGYDAFVTCFQVCIALIMSATILLYQMYLQPNNSHLSQMDTKPEHLSAINTMPLQQYLTYCHQTAWESSSLAHTQLECANLDGLMIEWNGYIQEIRVREIENRFKSVIQKFPKVFHNKLQCIFGEGYENGCTYMNKDCILLKQLAFRHECHLEGYNRYFFEIEVKVSTGVWAKPVSIYLLAKDEFKNFTLGLKTNDKISFKGFLTNNFAKESDELLGGSKPQVDLTEIRCTACENRNLTRYTLSQGPRLNLAEVVTYLFIGCKSVLNFLFNPIILFK